MTPQNNTPIQLAILTTPVYESLSRQFPILVNRETTDIMAGMQLGIQLVLQKLREGFVIDKR
jgi:hypothetical protein